MEKAPATEGQGKLSRAGLSGLFGPIRSALTGWPNAPMTGIAMKRCAQCHGKLGLGVRSRNEWNGRWWVHVLYCSTHCEALYELERYDARAKRGRHAFISRSSPQN